MSRFDNRSRAALSLVITIAFVALATVLAKDSLTNVHYVTFVWIQMLIAGIVMIAALIYTKQLRIKTIPLKIWLIVISIGILNFTIVRAIFIYTLGLLPATTHAYIINFVGIVTMFLSAILLKEPPTISQIIGALIAISGVRLYFWQLPLEGELNAILWLLFAIVCLALTNILMRKLHAINRDDITNLQISSYSILAGVIPLVIWGVSSETPVGLISYYDWFVIVLNSLVSICLVMLVFNWVLKTLRAFEASILATSGVIFTAFFSSIILSEVIDTFEALGITVMILGIYLVQKRRLNS